MGQPNGVTGTGYNPFRYTGTYLDTMTGMYQMGARYYQPGSGRFTQLDPKPEKLLTFNRYEYAGSNPCNFADPTGLHESVEDPGAGSLADECAHEAAPVALGGGISTAVAAGVGIGLGIVTGPPGWIIAGSFVGGFIGGAAAGCVVGLLND